MIETWLFFWVCVFVGGGVWCGVGGGGGGGGGWVAGGLKGKITLRKLILFETSFLSLQWLLKSLNDDDPGFAAQVDLKTSTLKSLHANWFLNTHNLILNAKN